MKVATIYEYQICSFCIFRMWHVHIQKSKIYKLRLHILNNGGQKIFISLLLCVWSAQICSPCLDPFFNRKVLGLERQEEVSVCKTAGSTFHAELRSSDIFKLCIVVLTIGLYMYFADFTFL